MWPHLHLTRLGKEWGFLNEGEQEIQSEKAGEVLVTALVKSHLLTVCLLKHAKGGTTYSIRKGAGQALKSVTRGETAVSDAW